MEKNENVNHKKLRDDSRFTRWVQELDEKDRSLSPMVRKSKWLLILAVIFCLFVISFIWMPEVRVNTGLAESPMLKTDSSNNAVTSTFEISVDSFENRLKQQFNEKLPEKE